MACETCKKNHGTQFIVLIPGFETEEHWRNDYPDELSDDDDDAIYRSGNKFGCFSDYCL